MSEKTDGGCNHTQRDLEEGARDSLARTGKLRRRHRQRHRHSHRATETRDTATQRHRDTETQRPRAAETPRHGDTETQRHTTHAHTHTQEVKQVHV